MAPAAGTTRLYGFSNSGNPVRQQCPPPPRAKEGTGFPKGSCSNPTICGSNLPLPPFFASSPMYQNDRAGTEVPWQPNRCWLVISGYVQQGRYRCPARTRIRASRTKTRVRNPASNSKVAVKNPDSSSRIRTVRIQTVRAASKARVAASSDLNFFWRRRPRRKAGFFLPGCLSTVLIAVFRYGNSEIKVNKGFKLPRRV
jgi:hypothetical protein